VRQRLPRLHGLDHIEISSSGDDADGLPAVLNKGVTEQRHNPAAPHKLDHHYWDKVVKKECDEVEAKRLSRESPERETLRLAQEEEEYQEALQYTLQVDGRAKLALQLITFRTKALHLRELGEEMVDNVPMNEIHGSCFYSILALWESHGRQQDPRNWMFDRVRAGLDHRRSTCAYGRDKANWDKGVTMTVNGVPRR
jgi:hypothetical protein